MPTILIVDDPPAFQAHAHQRCWANLKGFLTNMTKESRPDPQLKYPWRQAVLDAFRGARGEQSPATINAAERTIAARLSDSASIDLEEQAALQAALRSLRILSPAREPKGEPAEKKDVA